jgi:hypothetical protein
MPALPFCRLSQPRLVCAEYFASELVLKATLLQTSAIPDKDDPESNAAYIYTLRVDQLFRGKTPDRIRIYEENDSGRATFEWMPGTQYLLFLVRRSDANGWTLDGCGNSGPVAKKGAALSEIDAIKAAHDGGVIHGVVRVRTSLDFLPRIHVVAQGPRERYAATTDESGQFQIKVPAGRYSVRVVEDGRYFGTYDVSYEDADGIEIEPGGCAQIQLAETRGPAQ